ncbi:hypothetical protein SDIAM26S_05699 [Streptomyces diastaticus subsp. diastaticus]
MAATAAKKTNCMGITPNSRPWPRRLNSATPGWEELSEIGAPSEMSRAMPRKTLRVPRVTMKDGTPSSTTARPLKSPARTPTASPTAMAAAQLQPSDMSMPVEIADRA